ncbi:MAG: hypothetical protein K6G75_10785, partial [Lachnospiraceae bacterium]|nr:hypothetical protein [Lachnospiraceae bacterium]
MEIDKRIDKLIKNARKRLCRIKFYKGLLLAVIIGLAIWGIMQTISLFVPFYGAPIVGILLCMATIIIGVIITILRYPSKREAALMFDSKGFNERVITSMELKGKHDIFSSMQKEDTLQKTATVSMRKVFPMRINKFLFLFLFLGLMFVITTGLMPAKTKEIAQENHILSEEKKIAEDELEKLVAEIKESHPLSVEEVEKLDEMLKEAKEELKESDTSTEVDKVKERFENKIYDYIGENAPNEDQREAEAIQNALDAVKNDELDIKDQEEIAKELEDLAKKNQDEELQKTAEQMQNELEQNGEISDETAGQAQEQLDPYVNNNDGQNGQNGQNG